MGIMTEKSLELANFLKNHSIFHVLEMNVLESLSLLFSETVAGPGQIIFREGDAPDGLYVIRSGSVAVLQGKSESKVIAYLTAGECFGEMAFEHDSPRTATIRVPEEATILFLPAAAVKEISRKFPAVKTKISEVIQKRSAGRATFKAPGLQGNLAFFDLPTVLQTVLASRQNGVLSLYRQSGRSVGKIIMKDSSISSAEYAHLSGEHALYELLNSSEPLDFTFDQIDVSDFPAHKDLSGRPPHMLLIEGARRADELPKLLQSAGWPSSIYVQIKNVPDLSAFGTERRDLLRTLWNLIEMGCNTESICRQVPYDRYAVLGLLDEILKANWIKRENGPKATDEIARRTGQYRKPNLNELMTREHNLGEKSSGTMERPVELVRVINAFNGLSTNLGLLYGKGEVRSILQEALQKASKLFPVLSGLRVHIDSPCLDMRATSAEFSESQDSVAGILLLGNYLMELLVKSHNF